MVARGTRSVGRAETAAAGCLYDEAVTRLELQREFLQLKRQLSKTILLVTHDLQEALRLGDRIAVMKDGLLLQVAAHDELRRNPADDYVQSLLTMAGEIEA